MLNDDQKQINKKENSLKASLCISCIIKCGEVTNSCYSFFIFYKTISICNTTLIDRTFTFNIKGFENKITKYNKSNKYISYSYETV